MIFENLPEKNSQDEPNIVTISNPKLPSGNVDEKENPILGYKFEIPGPEFSYGQYEKVSEFLKDTGDTIEDAAAELIDGISTPKTLKLLNEFKRDAALTTAKAKIRTTVTGSPADILKAGIDAGKNHTFISTDTISAKDAKDTLTMLGGKLKEMSGDEIKAELAKALGITL